MPFDIPLEECCICREDILSQSALVFLVATCSHRFCSLCVTRLFEATGASRVNCPICRKSLQRREFKEDLDQHLRDDKAIRKKLSTIFCLRLQDFETEQHYHDYVDMVDMFVENLITRSDVESTNSKIEQWKALNRDKISLAKAREDQVKRDLLLKNTQYLDKLFTITITNKPPKLPQLPVEIKQEHIPNIKVETKSAIESRIPPGGSFAQPDPVGGAGFVTPKTEAEESIGMSVPMGLSLPRFVPQFQPQPMAMEHYDPTKDVVDFSAVSYEDTWEKELLKRMAGGWIKDVDELRAKTSMDDLFIVP
ncbi:hypothetical protein RCL1_000768 [Eukaryota sp. TZLM3-RCL]